MKLLPALAFLAFLSGPSARASCEADPVDLLILGDSQSGGAWASSYFGDFLQQCLSEGGKTSFALYARGGTQMVQWTGSPALDGIPTVYRAPEVPKRILGKKELPVCWKRASSLLEIHRPRRILLQFGDNLLSLPGEEIEKQTRAILREVKAAGIDAEDCYFATPTFEMAVRSRRNVPKKTLENTLRVTRAIEKASEGLCSILSGTWLLSDSALLQGETLERIPVPGTSGCEGGAGNDNIHACGEAARAWARAVCRHLR